MGMWMVHIPLGIAISVGAALSQDAVVIPNSHVAEDGSTSTNIPFGRSTAMRTQMIYDARLFSSAGVIEEVAFRLDGGQTATSKNVELEMRMSTLGGSILETDQEFASNRGADEAVVFDRKTVSLPAHDQAQIPNPFQLRFALDHDFAYDPADGSLVLEVIVHSQEPGAYTLDTTYVCISPQELVGPPACQGSEGKTLKVESATSQVMWGRALVLRVLDARLGTLTGLVLGTRGSGSWQGWELPQDLAILGAPGCFASIAIEALASKISAGDGSASYVFALPSDPSLQGLWIYFQASAVDLAANPLGVVTSQAARIQVCGWEPVARVYASGTGASKGLREIGVAPVVELMIR